VLSPKQLMTDIVLGTATPVGGHQTPSHHHGRDSSGDAELINSVARGDQGAGAQLYGRHRGCVHQLATRLYGRDQALRVTDEIFSALWSASGVVDVTDSGLCTVLLIATRAREFAGVASGPPGS
jgi:hypothetical protein